MQISEVSCSVLSRDFLFHAVLTAESNYFDEKVSIGVCYLPIEQLNELSNVALLSSKLPSDEYKQDSIFIPTVFSEQKYKLKSEQKRHKKFVYKQHEERGIKLIQKNV